MEIIAEPLQLKLLLQTYRGALEPIKRAVKSKVEYYSKFKSQEDLEKYGWEKGEKKEWVEEIKDWLILQQVDYISKDKVDLENQKKKLIFVYENIMDLLKRYVDLDEKYYPLIAIWIIGTYSLEDFETYPYLFLNAMKGSGKTRTIKIIKDLSWKGQLLTSLTEAVMFRTKGMLGIDEFEGITRKGNESLRELLNSAYKKGSKVFRMKKQKTLSGEEQVVEEFEPFRPIVVANIWGMEDVLGDRCIPIILEKSTSNKTKLVERWTHEKAYQDIITTLTSFIQCSLCRCSYENNIIEEWNNYITTLTTHTTITTLTTHSTLQKIYETGINGRYLELGFPLFVVGSLLGEEIFENILKIYSEIVNKKKDDNLTENSDISLYDMISQEPENNYFIRVKDLTDKFRQFLQSNEEWLNDKWMGRALKRLNLIIESKRISSGVQVKLNYKKAQEQISKFK